jgi:hypothetical protein
MVVLAGLFLLGHSKNMQATATRSMSLPLTGIDSISNHGVLVDGITVQ